MGVYMSIMMGFNRPLPVASLSISTMPSWWYYGYGMQFGEKYIFDAEYRVGSEREMRRILYDCFGHIGLGEADPPPVFSAPDFGNVTIMAAAGADIVYPQDNFPRSTHFSVEKCRILELPEKIEEVFPYSEILRQTIWQNEMFGFDIRPFFMPRSVVSETYNLMGEDYYPLMLDGDPVALNVTEYCARMFEMSVDYNCQKSNFHILDSWKGVTLFNCASQICGPSFYNDFYKPYDLRLAKKIKSYGLTPGLHHCGIFDKFLDTYQSLFAEAEVESTYLEAGWGSDVSEIFKRFPDVKIINHYISPAFLMLSTPAEIKDVISGLLGSCHDNLKRLNIAAFDLEYGTPAENIEAMYQAIAEYAPN